MHEVELIRRKVYELEAQQAAIKKQYVSAHWRSCLVTAP